MRDSPERTEALGPYEAPEYFAPGELCAACEALDEPGDEECPCACHIDDDPA